MISFRGVAEIEKSSPDSLRLEMSKFIKRSTKEMISFRWVAEIEKSSPDSPRLEMIKLIVASPGALPIPWAPPGPTWGQGS